MWQAIKKFWNMKVIGEEPKAPAIAKKKKSTFLDAHKGSGRTPVNAKRANRKAINSMFQMAIQRRLVVESEGKPGTAMDAAMAKSVTNLSAAMDSSVLPQVPNMLATWYGYQSFIGYQMCAVVAQQWLVNKACSMPGKDAVRKGWNITLNDGGELTEQQLDYIRQRDTELKVKQNLIEFSHFARVFGIRFVMFLVDGMDYEQPFNIDGVKAGSYRGMTQVDPYWTAPILDMEASADPVNKHFYEPTWWHTSSPNLMNLKIHRSHVCMLIPNPVADVLKPTYFFGGVPLTQQIYERVYNAEQAANEAYQLLQTKRLNILFADLDEALANQGELEERLAFFAQIRDNYGAKVLGEEERYEQHDTSLTDLDTTILTQYELVAAIAEIPPTKLLGHAPAGGMNDTGSYEEASYHEMLESLQNEAFTPVLERHYLLLCKSELEGKWPELAKANFIPAWPELDAMTEEERANVNKTKAETDQILLNAGGINGEMINKRVVSDPDSGYAGSDIVVEPPEDDTDDDADADGTSPAKDGEQEGKTSENK